MLDETDDDESPLVNTYIRELGEKRLEKAKIKVYFREVTGKLPRFPKDTYGLPDIYRSGRWFYVELHARQLIGWFGPLGLGVVHVTGPTAYLQSVQVADGARRTGLGERIVEAAGKRWPVLHWHGCDYSRKFHARLVEKGIAVRRDGQGDCYDFVPIPQRQQFNRDGKR